MNVNQIQVLHYLSQIHKAPVNRLSDQIVMFTWSALLEGVILQGIITSWSQPILMGGDDLVEVRLSPVYIHPIAPGH